MPAFDPFAIMRKLLEHDVKFVLIGGVAAAAHGSPVETYDLDICYARDQENLDRLALALRELKARLRGAPDDVPFLLDAETLAAGDHFTFETSEGDFDILGTPAGTDGFDDLVRSAASMEFDGIEALVCALEDLIRMKRAAGRFKDRQWLDHLGALRDELEERGEL